LHAQAEVYQLYAGKLFALSLKYSRNQIDAEDVLQDAFITIFHKIHQYKGKGSFEGWLKRIVVNTALQKYREKSPLQLVNSTYEVEKVEEEIEINEEEISVDFLLELIQQLPDRYRLVFNLYVLDGYSHKEISEMLGTSTGTSKSNLARAKMILREKIEKENINLA